MLPNKPHFIARKRKPTNFADVIAGKLEGAGRFSDGLLDGYVAFYNLDSARPTPLDGPTLAAFIAEIQADASREADWKSGYIVGWCAGLGESNAAYFFLEIQPAKES